MTLSALRILTASFLLSIFVATEAQSADDRRTISVTGHGSVPVTPDQVELSVGIEVSDPNVLVVKKKSDEVMRKTLAAAKSQKVADKDVQSDHVYIEAERNLVNGTENRFTTTYRARRTVRILLRDISQYEALVAALFNSGTNSLSNVQFSSSKAPSLQDEAKVRAMKAARANAEILAKEAGLKLGKPISISDASRPSQPMVNFKYSAAAMDSAAPTLAPGEIDVSYSVEVIFEALL